MTVGELVDVDENSAFTRKIQLLIHTQLIASHFQNGEALVHSHTT